ncbi:uncharacterized protein LOC126883682 [Diabrotica virgifera virgifera]|uniref:DDE-1 domain-containing protein n=1 Tax=Diabrotica virgifera virgifera TaxID=50390 RepID=A0ABM5K534_DIAVI|nr:uncharacterized protein LOC126883682 [Diabrotica virgifera virgifera]
MPRNYVRKRSARPYSAEDLRKAVADVSTNNLTYRQASALYGIPISNIFNRIKGRKIAEGKLGGGRNPIFTPEVEHDIAQYLMERSKMGYPCSKDELLQLVQNYVLQNHIKTSFKDGKPGHDWYIGFMSRHPRLTLKKAEHLQKSRMLARNPEIVYDFFDKLEEVISTYNILPSFTFNTDESGFSSDPSKVRGIGIKGKTLSRVSGGSGRENTTVLACSAADGTILPPLIIFKGAAVQARWTSPAAYPGTLYATTRNGWMEETPFFYWLQTCFIPHVRKKRLELELPDATALLLYDGHSSHVSLRIIELAMEANIQIIKFPSHLTDNIQPLDKCVFGPVKKAWDRKLVEFGKANIGVGTGRLQKRDFVELLGLVWAEAMTKSNIKAGFITTGICPVNRKRFPESLFDPIALLAYQKRKRRSDVGSVIEPAPEMQEAENSNSSVGFVSETEGPGSSGSSAAELEKAGPSKLPSLPATVTDSSIPCSPSAIVQIFAEAIREKRSLTSEIQVAKKPTPRLKQLRYGEVVTTEEVAARFREAENKKIKRPKTVAKLKTSKTNTTENKLKKKTSSSSSDDNSSDTMSLHDESDDSKFVNSDTEQSSEEDSRKLHFLQENKKVKAESLESSDETEMNMPLAKLREKIQVKVGDFIIVKFIYNLGTKKQIKKNFVAEVVDLDINISAKFFRKSSKTTDTYIFPLVEDKQVIDFDQIVAIIKPSNIMRGRYVFPNISDYRCC